MTPIHHHSILSDQRTIALLDDRANLRWLCLPRLDAPAMFAGLLGGPGEFSITPHGSNDKPRIAYVGDSLVLRSAWPGLTLTDYLDTSGGRAFQRAGRTDLLRVLEATEPTTVTLRFAPRVDFGRVPTRLTPVDNGLLIDAGADPSVLVSPGVEWTIEHDGKHHTAVATITVTPKNPLTLEFRFGSANHAPARLAEADRRKQTERFWSGWAGSLRVPGLSRDLVVRSALVLKALSYGPTGSIAAAATTSLPEWFGGVRNWDYRFCWLRDAALAAEALIRLGNTGHAMRLVDWMVGIVDRIPSPELLRPLYTLTGDELGAEAEISELPGYRDSRPVRVGNAAAQQVQLDVFGPIVGLVASMTTSGLPVSPDAWRLVRAMVTAVERRWREPDHGIWEIRGPKRHHLHSKVMCWFTVDRALIVHDAVLGGHNRDWAALRDAIAADILANGWHDSVKSFTGFYGGESLDASVLAIGLSGLLPVSDPRWPATVAAVERHLLKRGPSGSSVYRYFEDDGLPGKEGGFLICLGWLIEALVTLGQRDRAMDLFEELTAMAGPTGLLPEEWDEQAVNGDQALGNFPQAYSHLAVINSAVKLSQT